MQPIRTEDEFTCQKCDRDAVIAIQFESMKVVLCEIHKEQFENYIKDEHL